MAYQSWSVVFGEQPSAAKWNVLGTNDAYFDSIVGSGTAWASWTPSYANLTIGNGTVTAKYIQIGKTVLFHWIFVLGGTSAVGTAPTISLPVTAATRYGTNNHNIGGTYFADTGTTSYIGQTGILGSTSVFQPLIVNSASTYTGPAQLTSTVPHTWANTDVMSSTGQFEAA